MAINIYYPLFGDEIRVLTLPPGRFDDDIELTLQPVFLNKYPEYDALSYTWQSDLPPETIKINGNKATITGNLASALRHLRKPDEQRVLWADAICIDQSNVQERSQQVDMMRQIYPFANEVLVWLGPSANDSDYVLQELGSIMKRCVRQLIPDERFWAGLLTLCRRPYWERLWILQEVAMARPDPVIICGHERSTWASFHHAIGNLSRYTWRSESSGLSMHIEEAKQVTEVVDRVCEIQKRRFDGLLNLLWLSQYSYASDARDKVFGILGLVHPDCMVLLRADYSKSARQVYIDTVTALLCEHGPLVYYTHPLYERHILSSSGANTMPSWLPNMDRPRFSHRSPKMPRRLYITFFYSFGSNRKVMKVPLKFGHDYSLTTFGSHYGIVSSIAPVPPESQLGSSIATWLQEMHLKCSVQGYSMPALLQVLVPDFDQEFPNFGFHEPEDLSYIQERLDHHNGILAKRIVQNSAERVLLALRTPTGTPTKMLGMTNGLNEVQLGDHIVGLFGMDWPFILRPRDDGTWIMVNIARLGGHTLDTEVREDYGTWDQWVEKSGLQTYTIV